MVRQSGEIDQANGKTLLEKKQQQQKEEEEEDEEVLHGRVQQQPGTASASALGKQVSPLLLESQRPCIVLVPLNDTFETKTLQLPFLPDVIKIGRQTNKFSTPRPTNGFFESRVLSRSHAEMWANEDGRACLKDVRSSNGTFVNGTRLSKENEESGVRELFPGDTIELGIDILDENAGTVIHHKVSARVSQAGFAKNTSLQNAVEVRGQHNATLRSNSGSKSGSGSGSGSEERRGADRFTAAPNSTPGITQIQMGSGRHHVTIDMVIKKLSNDLKVSKQIAADLKHASAIFTHTVSPTAVGGAAPATATATTISTDASASEPAPAHQVTSSRSDAAITGKHGEATHESSLPSMSLDHAADTPHSLSRQLAATRQALEEQEARVQELESTLMLEREARITIEEKWRTMVEVPSNNVFHDDDDGDEEDAASVRSARTVTASDQQQPNAVVPAGMDEVSAASANVVGEKLEILLRETREEMEAWRVRAESAERGNVEKTSRIMQLVKDLERHTSPTTTRSPNINTKPSGARHGSTVAARPSTPTQDQRRNQDGGSSAALVGMVAVVMLGVGLLNFVNHYSGGGGGIRKELV